ncbi:MAG TPA: helix-turn-helix domain-containing protein [Acidimicrobiia bacterium]|nr:helix-turn-helix domain-containing protein [Acidimicrobiia bacterium]
MGSGQIAKRADPTTVSACEVDTFESAVAGLHIEYVRTDGGERPCVATFAATGDAAVSVGSVGFSVIAQTEIPLDRNVFALIRAAPPGARWNEVELRPGDVFAYAPGTTFFGVEPARAAATILVLPTDYAASIASDLGLGDPEVGRGVAPLPASPAVQRLALSMKRSFERPQFLADQVALAGLVEDAVRVATRHDISNGHRSRRLDSRTIVRNCLDYVESTGWRQPAMRALCRAAFASESRVRRAFIDVVGVPPIRYLQMRQLSAMRSALIEARPDSTSVTEIAMSLGVTQLGRVAGRYRSLYEELPSQTLRNAP